ncbi:hypothetical protein CLV63_13217 [Murinocardiopsis flavida]|uniref:Uncharacterized protein n=1 Tax=Murinocardiopsis flavida TaxID=645275 RepID=A0A2P8CQY6_9ACTN|nr:hypothetical protein [Murinocardiopsis flavida]PSK87362.1 hypothetical protein CLV63_13217 [Murinocardiopsis flavida]
MGRQLPSSVKATRVLLFIAAGLYAVTIVVANYLYGFNGVTHAYLVWTCWPGVFAFAFALRIPKGGKLLMWSIVVLEVLRIMMSLGELDTGQGFTQMILPVVTMIAVLKRPSRQYFAAKTPVNA